MIGLASVECFRCKENVQKANARLFTTLAEKKVFECNPCAQKSKAKLWSLGEESLTKNNYFCDRCKYKFSSRKSFCPYCSKNDQVVSADVKLGNLL